MEGKNICRQCQDTKALRYDFPSIRPCHSLPNRIFSAWFACSCLETPDKRITIESLRIKGFMEHIGVEPLTSTMRMSRADKRCQLSLPEKHLASPISTFKKTDSLFHPEELFFLLNCTLQLTGRIKLRTEKWRTTVWSNLSNFPPFYTNVIIAIVKKKHLGLSLKILPVSWQAHFWTNSWEFAHIKRSADSNQLSAVKSS